MSNNAQQTEIGLSKLRISMDEGILEVEGREEFILQVYEDFRQSAAKDRLLVSESKKERPDSNKVSKENEKRSRKAKGSRGQPQVLENLDLSASNGRPSLQEYYAGLAIKTNLERNLVFVYYLQKRTQRWANNRRPCVLVLCSGEREITHSISSKPL